MGYIKVSHHFRCSVLSQAPLGWRRSEGTLTGTRWSWTWTSDSAASSAWRSSSSWAGAPFLGRFPSHGATSGGRWGCPPTPWRRRSARSWCVGAVFWFLLQNIWLTSHCVCMQQDWRRKTSLKLITNFHANFSVSLFQHFITIRLRHKIVFSLLL